MPESKEAERVLRNAMRWAKVRCKNSYHSHHRSRVDGKKEGEWWWAGRADGFNTVVAYLDWRLEQCKATKKKKR